MLLPFESVVRRGVAFRYPRFQLLADPALAGETKPKYLVIVSSSPLDAPILFLLTTSEKPKHLNSALRAEFMHIPAGKYSFLPKGTIINAEAGELTFDREDLQALS